MSSIKSNTEKSRNGIDFEKIIYNNLKQNQKKYNIHNVKKQVIACDKTLDNEIKEALIKAEKKYGKKLSKEKKKKIIYEKCKKHHDNKQVLRDKKRYNKRSDIRFKTNNKYIVNGKLTDLNIITDSTTSARGDRLKAKAQDALIYKKEEKLPHIYLVILPNDDFYIKKGYLNPNNEIRNGNNACYKHNFQNEFKQEGISLILKENDFYDFITYINKHSNEDINKIIENFIHKQFPNDVKKASKDFDKFMESMYDKFL